MSNQECGLTPSKQRLQMFNVQTKWRQRKSSCQEVVPGCTFLRGAHTSPPPPREKLTRNQNRKEHWEYGLERAKDKPGRAVGADTVLGITSRDLRRLQEEDSGLLQARELAEGKTEEVSSGYFWREGLLFHKWTSSDGDEAGGADFMAMGVEEVSPALGPYPHSRDTWARRRQRERSRFYWPTL